MVIASRKKKMKKSVLSKLNSRRCCEHKCFLMKNKCLWEGIMIEFIRHARNTHYDLLAESENFLFKTSIDLAIETEHMPNKLLITNNAMFVLQTQRIGNNMLVNIVYVGIEEKRYEYNIEEIHVTNNIYMRQTEKQKDNK